MTTPLSLPLAGPALVTEAPVERADAARNRARLLAAAERLFAERGPGCVSMDEVALAAGVGKGTLFRRFGSREGLMRELLGDRERELQDALIRGEAPLGPGAPPRARLHAFGDAVLDVLEENAELLLIAESSRAGARFASPPYAVYRLHLTILVRESCPRADAEFLAETLLAALGADLFTYLRRVREMPLERIKAGWGDLVRRTLGEDE